MSLPEIPEISFKFVGKPDNLNTILDPDEIKAALDAGPEEARQATISLTNALNSITDGASGADNIGATQISTSPTTIQGILEWLKSQIDTIVAGGVADSSVTDAKLSDVDGQIKERFQTYIDTPIADAKLSDAAGQIKDTISKHIMDISTGHKATNVFLSDGRTAEQGIATASVRFKKIADLKLTEPVNVIEITNIEQGYQFYYAVVGLAHDGPDGTGYGANVYLNNVQLSAGVIYSIYSDTPQPISTSLIMPGDDNFNGYTSNMANVNRVPTGSSIGNNPLTSLKWSLGTGNFATGCFVRIYGVGDLD